MFASILDATASASSPPEPPAYEEVTFQQVMDEVRTLSMRQTNLEQHILVEHQRFS